MKGYYVKYECYGEGKTKNEALENLLYDFHNAIQQEEFDSGLTLTFEECEIEE